MAQPLFPHLRTIAQAAGTAALCHNRTHAPQQADLLDHLAAAFFAQSLHCHDASMLPCAFFFLHFAFLFRLVRRKSINACNGAGFCRRLG